MKGTVWLHCYHYDQGHYVLEQSTALERISCSYNKYRLENCVTCITISNLLGKKKKNCMTENEIKVLCSYNLSSFPEKFKAVLWVLFEIFEIVHFVFNSVLWRRTTDTGRQTNLYTPLLTPQATRTTWVITPLDSDLPECGAVRILALNRNKGVRRMTTQESYAIMTTT